MRYSPYAVASWHYLRQIEKRPFKTVGGGVGGQSAALTVRSGGIGGGKDTARAARVARKNGLEGWWVKTQRGEGKAGKGG